MRVHARLVLVLFGLALAVPAWVVAAPPGDGDPAAERSALSRRRISTRGSSAGGIA